MPRSSASTACRSARTTRPAPPSNLAAGAPAGRCRCGSADRRRGRRGPGHAQRRRDRRDPRRAAARRHAGRHSRRRSRRHSGFNGTGPTIPGVTGPARPGAPVTPGALGNTVDGVENTAGDLGLNLPLDEITQGLTGPLDKTVNDAVNGVGGLLGDNKLGDKVTGTVNGLLGPGGATDGLLGGGN